MKSRGTAFAVVLALVWAQMAMGAWIPIDGAYTIPSQPATTDPITIVAYGQVGYINTPIDHTDFYMADTSLQLDIFFDFSETLLPMVAPWSHSEPIGMLSEDSYTLTVRTFEWPVIVIADTYLTSFEVVPEPATVLLLGLGGLALLRRRRA